MNKLALGTAQFGFDYGISNKYGQVKLSEVKKIFNLAKKNQIDTIDTAIAYGESEKILGELDTQDFKIITKLPGIPEDCLDVDLWLEKHIKNSLKRLNVQSLHGLLLHNSKDLLSDKGKMLVDSLKKIKSNGLVNKIGVSVYAPSEFDRIFDLIKIDIVQAPLNIIDRRFETSGLLTKLYNDGIEIHIRSVFLQGLLLMPRKKIPKKFDRWSLMWDRWSSELNKKKFTALEACLSYPLSLPEVNKIIIGVNSADHLKEILKIYKSNRNEIDFSFMNSSDHMLINPNNWSNL